MEQIYGNCDGCGTEGPLDKNKLCSVCGTKDK